MSVVVRANIVRAAGGDGRWSGDDTRGRGGVLLCRENGVVWYKYGDDAGLLQMPVRS